MGKIEFSNFLKRRLHELRLNESEFAKELILSGYKKVSKQSVNLWTNGKRSPELSIKENRDSLAKVLKVDISEILEILDYVQHNENKSHESIYAAELVERMSDEKRKMAIGILEQIIGG